MKLRSRRRKGRLRRDILKGVRLEDQHRSNNKSHLLHHHLVKHLKLISLILWQNLALQLSHHNQFSNNLFNKMHLTFLVNSSPLNLKCNNNNNLHYRWVNSL